MTVDAGAIATESGDEIVVTLWDHDGQPPTLAIFVTDVDGTEPPTAELSMADAGRLRELIRGLEEKAARRQMLGESR